jgi:putative addiction module component (TIGR02574 family)
VRKHLLADILELPVAQRLQLAEAIWASVSSIPDAFPLTAEQREELDRCLAEYEADPDEGSTLEEVFARVRRGG